MPSTARVTAVPATVRRAAAGARRGRSARRVSTDVPQVGLASTAPRRAAVAELLPSNVAPSPANVRVRPDSPEIPASAVSWPRFSCVKTSWRLKQVGLPLLSQRGRAMLRVCQYS